MESQLLSLKGRGSVRQAQELTHDTSGGVTTHCTRAGAPVSNHLLPLEWSSAVGSDTVLPADRRGLACPVRVPLLVSAGMTLKRAEVRAFQIFQENEGILT